MKSVEQVRGQERPQERTGIIPHTLEAEGAAPVLRVN